MIVEIKGNLIDLSLSGQFDLITHGCNCFCTMKKGIAKEMDIAFQTSDFPLEDSKYKGDKKKLGMIDYKYFEVSSFGITPQDGIGTDDLKQPLIVINSYTQYEFGGKHPFNYDAFRSCMKEIAKTFPGKILGIPKIGAGLGGGDWNKIKKIIEEEQGTLNIIIVSL